MACCILWHGTLEEVGADYLDLTACEIFLTHEPHGLQRSLCSFKPLLSLIKLEAGVSPSEELGS